MKRIGEALVIALDKPVYVIACTGMSVVILMMVLTSGDSISRSLFNYSVVGVHELIEFMMVILVFLALAYTEVTKGHVVIDAVATRLPKRLQRILESLTSLLSLVIYVLITWQTALYGIEMSKSGVISPTLNIPIFPFVFITAFGNGLLCLVLLRKTLCSFLNWRNEWAQRP